MDQRGEEGEKKTFLFSFLSDEQLRADGSSESSLLLLLLFFRRLISLKICETDKRRYINQWCQRER